MATPVAQQLLHDVQILFPMRLGLSIHEFGAEDGGSLDRSESKGRDIPPAVGGADHAARVREPASAVLR